MLANDFVICSTMYEAEAETLTTMNIKMEKQSIFTSDILSGLSSSIKHIPDELPSCLHAVLKESAHAQLGHIVPANRSNLSFKQHHNLIPRNKNEMPCLTNRQRNHGDSKTFDNKFVDSITDVTDDRKMGPEDVLEPCSVKFPKKLKLVNEEYSHAFAVSSKQICRLEPESLDVKKRKSVLVNPMISNKGKDVANVASEGSISKFPLKENQNCPSSQGQDFWRGYTFLAEVQEKLTCEEYKEFVSFLRALKSKTMKITSILESIARLFSAPGRLTLLKGFKHFVPEKYRPLYEQHLRAHASADDGN